MPMIELTTAKGALDDAARQRLAAERRCHPKPIYRVTPPFPKVRRARSARLRSGIAETHRVWVQLRQMTNGRWAGFGEIVWRLQLDPDRMISS